MTRDRGIGDGSWWYCNSCGKSVQGEDVYTEYYPATRYEPSEITYICPECGSEDTLVEAPYECKRCKRMFPCFRMDDIDDLCQDCYEATVAS